MSKKIAIIQSNYIPWKGYFDIINMVDEFILYDDVQYTKNDWRNRNRIKTRDGAQWITIPVHQHTLSQKIRDTKVAGNAWRKKHWKTIIVNYSHSKHFKEYRDIFEDHYLNRNEQFLSEINYCFINLINGILDINTKISWSTDYQSSSSKTERLVNLCNITGASEYITGPAAREYLDEELFAGEGIRITYMDYSGYPEYHQMHPPFEHRVSILDLIFNEGLRAKDFMKSFKVKR